MPRSKGLAAGLEVPDELPGGPLAADASQTNCISQRSTVETASEDCRRAGFSMW